MSQLNSLYILDSKKEVSCPQTHNCLLTGYGTPRSPSASQDPIQGIFRDWVQIFETPTPKSSQSQPNTLSSQVTKNTAKNNRTRDHVKSLQNSERR